MEQVEEHPDAEQLRAFVEGRIDGEQAAALEEHLAGCEACIGQLAELPRTPLIDELQPVKVDEAPVPILLGPARRKVKPGKDIPLGLPAIAGYQILSVLGRGGMGVVYQARQIKLNRVVALKMILGGYGIAPEHRSRFFREAEAAARLQHPNIVQIHEVGEMEGRAYFTLEYVAGGSLSDRLNGTPLPARDAAKMIRTLARAIHYAHQLGIVHRDLKPENILVSAEGLPKIADFGLAKQVDLPEHQTRSGAVLGTPSYMAPEQARGQTRALGPLTDVYGLGAILYELLTGRPPFKAPSAMETLVQVMHEEPVAPRRLQPTVPRDLEMICLKCLHKEPARRYGSAEALALDVERYLQGQPIEARAPRVWERSVRWCRRNRAAAVAIACAMTLAVSLVTVLVMPSTTLPPPSDPGEWHERWQKEHETRLSLEEKLRLLAQSTPKPAVEKKETDPTRAAAVLQAHLCLERGYGRWQDGSPQETALWLANGLRHAVRGQDVELEQEMRRLLGAWTIRLPRLEHRYQPGDDAPTVFSPDANGLVTTSGRSARVIALPSTKMVRELVHNRDVVGALFSPDGKKLATMTDNGVAHVARVDSGYAVEPFNYEGTLLAVSNQGQALTRDHQGIARLWDMKTGTRLDVALQKTDVILAAFNHTGDRLVTVARDQSARVWNLENGQPFGAIIRPLASVAAAAFSQDGKKLLFACEDNLARRWDLDAGNFVASWPHPAAVKAIAFSPDGALAATGCVDGHAYLWDLHDNQRLGTLIHSAPVGFVAFDAKGQKLLVAGSDRSARTWGIPARGVFGQRLPHPATVNSLSFHPSGARLMTGAADNGVRLWDLKKGSMFDPPLRTVGPVNVVCFHPEGRMVLVADRKSGPQLLDDDLSKKIEPSLFPVFPIVAGAFSPDGKTLLVSNADGFALAWESASRQVLGPPHKLPPTVLALGFRQDARIVLTATRDGNAVLWDALSGEPWGIKQIKQRQTLTAAAFSRDGARLLTGSKDHTACWWNLLQGTTMLPPLLHRAPVTHVALCDDNRHALTAAADQTVRLWDLVTGRMLGPPLPHPAAVTGLVFHPEGKLFATACEDRQVRLWDIAEPKSGGPDQVQQWVQSITGLELDTAGIVRSVAP